MIDGVTRNADGTWNVFVALHELLQACVVGGAAYYAAQEKRYRDNHGFSDRERVGWGLGIQIDGALGELVVAKLLGRYWAGGLAFKEADVGKSVQVRHLQGPDLVVRPDDPEDHVYVLVTGKVPLLTVVGWIKGVDAKVPDRLGDFGNGRDPVFRIPGGELHRVPARQVEEARAA